MGNEDTSKTPSGSGTPGRAILDPHQVEEFADPKLATDTRPPSFGGQAEEKVEHWLRKFKRISRALELDEKTMLRQAPIYLDAFAANWYDKETKRGTQPIATWAAFITAITDRFRPTASQN